MQGAEASHPRLTWSAIGSLIGAAAVIVPGVVWTIAHFETVAEAERMRVDLLTQISEHAKADGRVAAWNSVQMVRNELLAQRNRVNDCNILRDRKAQMHQSLSDLERAACEQYAQDYDSAKRRLDDALKYAGDISKEKP